MEMFFHGNQHLWAVKHPFISLYSKYHSLNFVCLPVMNSPIIPSLDDIYCMWWMNGPTDLTTNTARSVVACPHLKSAKKSFSAPTHPYVTGTDHGSNLVLSYADILWIRFYKFLLLKELLICLFISSFIAYDLIF